MRYEARISAYDLMDQVFVVTTVWTSSQVDSVKHEVVLNRASSFSGVGETDPGEWLRDVAVGIIETL